VGPNIFFQWPKDLAGMFDQELATLLIFALFARNVLAALDSDSGRIIWRHKFEEDDSIGRILDVAAVGKYVASASGSANLFLRLWEPTKGAVVQVSNFTFLIF
jgi:hypothetical protein